MAQGHYEDGQRRRQGRTRIGAVTAGAMAGVSREQGAGSREQVKGFGGCKLDVFNTYIGVGKQGISFINRMLEWLQ